MNVLITLFSIIVALYTNTLSAQVITQVSMSGQFQQSDGTVYILPANSWFNFGDQQDITFTQRNGSTTLLVPFNIDFIRTDDLGNNRFSDVVQIRYESLAGTDFYSNPASFIFDGHYGGNKTLLIDTATSDRSDWKLSDSIPLPASSASFYATSAPNGTVFTFDYLYCKDKSGQIISCPEPSALWLMIIGLSTLGISKRNPRKAEPWTGSAGWEMVPIWDSFAGV